MSEADQVVSVSRRIGAEAQAIFAVLADPARHHEFDGSNTVVAARTSSPERLELGARFGMDMRLGVPYRITNEVVEFDEDERIAWRHFGRHVWRYELEPADGGTLVTESFDWGSSLFPPLYEWLGHPVRHRVSMTKTLERLDALVSS